MESPVAATLHISSVTSQVYRVLYTVSNGSGGAATPYSIQGQAQVKAVLHQFGLNTAEIDMIIARVGAGMSYVLDLGHLDKATVASVLLRACIT